MGSNDIKLGWVLAAALIAGAATAQDAPSWRALQEAPKRPDVPPEVERPQYEFSVSRDELQGFSMPEEYRPGDAGDELIVVRPRRSSSEPAANESGRLVYSEGSDPAPVAPVTVESNDRRVPIVETEPRRADAFTPAPAADRATGYRLVRQRTVEPEYPERANRDGLEGWVNLRVIVSPNGIVAGVEVVEAEPVEVFDAAAMRAVRQWRFEPPRLAGVTAPQSKLYRIWFRLDDD